MRRAALIVMMMLVTALPAWAGAGAVRPARLAGAWYPADSSELARSVDAYLKEGRGPLPAGRIVALVAPHAGHVYSGAVAGHAWYLASRIAPTPKTVVLVGPSHYYPLTRPSIWTRGGYESPLGTAPADEALARELDQALGGGFIRAAHIKEHCLEVQIPFLRRALPKASMVAVLTGRPDMGEAVRQGKALARVIKGRPVLLVASTDLSHFHDISKAQVLDSRVAARVKALDPEGLLQIAAEGKAEACGLQALAMVMCAARELGAGSGQVFAMDTSATASGDKSRVVGYMAAAFTAPDSRMAAACGVGDGAWLDENRQATIRKLAWRSVQAAVKGEPLPKPPQGDPMMNRPAGVFVTLKKKGRLRGCMGRVVADLPLGEAVVRMARTAALDDPRFTEVTPAELKDLELEVSVLTPFQPCSPKEVRVGTDGLMIELGRHRGLLLPQAPVELGWSRTQFLDGLCRKAGLPPGAWQGPGAKLMRFQAQVF